MAVPVDGVSGPGLWAQYIQEHAPVEGLPEGLQRAGDLGPLVPQSLLRGQEGCRPAQSNQPILNPRPSAALSL